MKEYAKEELEKIFEARKQRVADFLKEHEIAAAVFEDTEERRNPSVRYFSAHPSDAILIVTADGRATLVPWDENLARERAIGCEVVPYNRFERTNVRAVREILKSLKIAGKKKVALSPQTPYPLFLKYVDFLSQDGWDVLCHEKSVHDFAVELRAEKDEYEIECTREACRVGDIIINEVERGLREGWLKKEIDVALLIESELRKHGCEKTGFDTLAAGPKRSWAIHAFPGYTDSAWGDDGLSILDFGVVFNGYTSDTTLTVVKNPTEKQEELVSLVENAAQIALPLYANKNPVRLASQKVNDIFSRAKRTMPHTLGHGIGLEIHEFPRVSHSQSEDVIFKPGMIVTLEPGLYDSKLGGVRLENDVLITENGNEVLSHSKIIRL